MKISLFGLLSIPVPCTLSCISKTNQVAEYVDDRLPCGTDRPRSRARRTRKRHRRRHRHVRGPHMASLSHSHLFHLLLLLIFALVVRWFLHDYLPAHPSTRTRRRNPLATPRWFARLFGPQEARSAVRSGAGYTMMGPSTGRASGVAAGGGNGAGLRERGSSGYAWGRGGQRLGGS